MWLYHLFLFGLRRLLCDLRPDISIASISTAVHAPPKLEGGGPNLRQSTSFWYMFINSKMLFRSGFVFSRIHTTELIFYQLLLSLDRSLKLIWIVYVIRNFSFTLQRLWCTQLQLDSNTFVFPKQDMQWTRKIFSASRLRQTLCFFFPSRGEKPDVCQEKITCLYVQLFYCSRTDLFFLHVCHNQQVNLLWTEIWSAGGVERPNWEPPPRTRGQFFLCIFEINFLYSKFCSCGQLNQANPKIPPS